MQLEIIILIILIILSGFFSGVEVAFFSLSKIHVNQIVKAKRKHAHALQKLKNNPNRFIITVLIGNNIVNIFSASLATKVALDVYGDAGIAIATGIMTLVVLVAGEIIPKSYCSRNAEKVALFSAPYLIFLSVMLTPIIWLLEHFTKFVLKLMGAKDHDGEKVDEKTLKELIQIGEESGHIKRDEREMIANVFEFDDTKVSDVMIARDQAVCTPVNADIDSLLKIMMETGYSRIPIHEKDDANRIVGVVHIKQIIELLHNRNGKKLPSIKSIMNEPYYVPESKKINSLFKGFQKKQVHLAVVVNEYGSFEGVVTLEDVIEELVGEVYDETDVDESMITKVDSKTFIVKGECQITEFNTTLGVRFDNSEFDTINGYIVHTLGYIPKKGSSTKVNRLEFIVVKADNTKVLEFKVKKTVRKKAKAK